MKPQIFLTTAFALAAMAAPQAAFAQVGPEPEVDAEDVSPDESVRRTSGGQPPVVAGRHWPNRAPTSGRAPLAHAPASMRGLPSGWTVSRRTAPSPQATTGPSPSTATSSPGSPVPSATTAR